MRSAGGVPFLSTLCDLDTINFTHALTGYLVARGEGSTQIHGLFRQFGREIC